MKRLIIAFALFLLLASPLPGWAADTCTFTNGGVNNLWSTAGNWDVVPDAADDTIIINGTCEVDADLSANCFTSFTINAAKQCTVLTACKLSAATAVITGAMITAGTGLFDFQGTTVTATTGSITTAGTGTSVTTTLAMNGTCTIGAETTLNPTGAVTGTGTWNNNGTQTNGSTMTLTGGTYNFGTASNTTLTAGGNITITSPAQMLCATFGSPLGTAYTCTINLNGAYYLTGNGLFALYGQNPTHLYCKLSGAETAATPATLDVDTDLTGAGDSWAWKIGASLEIADVNGYDAEPIDAITAITSSTISISDLTNDKVSGAYVVTRFRNVRIIGGTNATGVIYSASNSANFIRAEISNNNLGYQITASSGQFEGFAGGVTAGAYYAVYANLNLTINNMVVGSLGTGSCLAIGGSAGGLNCTNSILMHSTSLYRPISVAAGRGGNFYNTTFVGATNGVNSCSNVMMDTCSFIGVTSPWVDSSGLIVANSTTTSSTTDITRSDGQWYNCALNGVSENSGYNTYNTPRTYTVSENHDQSDGATKSWSLGGVCTSQVVTYPTGRTWAFKLIPESATHYGFYEERFTLAPKETLRMRCHFRKDTLGMTVEPTIQILLQRQDPLIYSGYSPLVQASMSNTTNVWETQYISYTNSGPAELFVIVRVLAKNATGNVYFLPERIRTPELMNKGNWMN